MIKSLYKLYSYTRSFPAITALRLRGALIGKRVRFYNNFVSLPWTNSRGLILGNDVQICNYSTLTIVDDGELSIYQGTSIGKFNQIFCTNEIYIGPGCLFSDFVKITDGYHIFDSGRSPVVSGFRKGESIFIGSNCFIGQGVVIEPGVRIGDNCVIGAYAVLPKNTRYLAGSVLVGQPARKVNNEPRTEKDFIQFTHID